MDPRIAALGEILRLDELQEAWTAAAHALRERLAALTPADSLALG